MKIAFGKAVLCATFMVVAVGAQAGEYRWLNSWDRTQLQIPLLAEPYIKAVEAASNGSIKLNVSGPETVPPFDQLQPASAGAFQFLFTHGAYHFGTTPMLAAIEALGGTPQQRRESGVFELVDKHYQKHGMKLVALPQSGPGGYQIILRKPPTANGDLAGHKIRGNTTYQSVTNMLGAAMVTLPLSEVFTSMEKGVIDGFAFPGYGVVSARFHEVSKYVLRPGFGYGTNPILVNLAAWNRMPPAEQKIFIDEGRKAEERWLPEVTKLLAQEEVELVGKGLQVVRMGAAQQTKLQQAWSEGLLELARPKIPEEIAALKALAKAKGIE